MSRFVKWVLLLLIGWPFFAAAQLQITHPMARLVVQRDAAGNGRLYVAGRLTSAVDRVEAQLTPVAAEQGTATGWQTIQTNPTNNIFLGYITGFGGWYILTVRTVVGTTVIEQATVQPVGIGEVFITAGQSNARGLGIGDNDLGTATDRVNAIDSINHSYPPGAQALVSSGDPFPVPVFKALTATRRIFPMAESSWAWGELGDYVVNRFNVPVAFYVTGWDAATVENWINTANGIPACNRYFCVENWPNLQPYTNLKNVLSYYASVAGARAVLWSQGESEFGDASSGTIPQYANQLTALIQKSRQDFGGRNIPWVVARQSYDGQVTRPDLISAQQQVINTAGLNVFQGPYSDTIINRNAGATDVHFRNASRPSPHPNYYLNQTLVPQEMGLSRFARNWNNSLTNDFFQNASPITPTQFAVTGKLAEYVTPGATLSVAFSTLGTFNADNQWQVQLLDSLGRYKAVLGTGSASPISVTLPGSYQSGQYQVRVVSTSPAVPAVPSNLFRITTSADLTPLIYVRPSTVSNTTDVTVVVDVPELNNVATNGLITVRVTRDTRANLTFPTSATLIGGRSVQNSAWSFSPDANYYTLTTTQPIAAGNVLSFGLIGILTPNATTGTLTISSVIIGGSGGEPNSNNNVDADKVDYFQN